MKKLNNKGFAISTMLYGLLILIVLIIAMILSTMAFNRKNSREFSEKIIDDLEKRTTIKLVEGKYVKMTPTADHFTINTTMTGYSSDQTINPNELKLWRVIRINDDNTVDMVSEYVSSTEIYFQGKTGYINYVGALNLLAEQYENKKYTVKTRCMGYYNQTKELTDTKALFSTTVPQTSSTSNDDSETKGLGDIGYKTDYELVKSIYGEVGLAAKTVGTNSNASYWLASRNYDYDVQIPSIWRFQGRYVYNDNNELDSTSFYYLVSGNVYEKSMYNAIRPIVTIHSTISASSGDGTITNPYVLD